MRTMFLPLVLALAAFPAIANADLSPDVQAAIAKMGHVNDPKTEPLFAPLHKAGIPADVKVTRDLAFGSDPKQKLDMFTSGEGTGKPVLMYVHGGGFTAGDKHPPGAYKYDNVLIWAAKNGLVGVDTNYRLAPQSKYPAADDDVAMAIKYVREHAREYGGDPNKIFVWGHSAGASLVGILISHPNFLKESGGSVAGAIMTSGNYEFTKENAYLGGNPAELADRSSVNGLKKTAIPLFFTRAEWDMPETMEQGDMINKVLTEAGHDHYFHLMKGHNHMSQIYSVGTSEHQLTGPLLNWIRQHAGSVESASAK